jgi:hypothetical protein
MLFAGYTLVRAIWIQIRTEETLIEELDRELHDTPEKSNQGGCPRSFYRQLLDFSFI